jgi:hypothetical protein
LLNWKRNQDSKKREQQRKKRKGCSRGSESTSISW